MSNREQIAEIVGRFYDDEYEATRQAMIDALTAALDEKDKVRCEECDQVIEGSHFCFICIQVLKEKLAQLDDAELLSDLSAWITFRLEHVKQQAGRIPPTFTDGYSYVEIPEWEMRQKLAALEAVRKGKETG